MAAEKIVVMVDHCPPYAKDERVGVSKDIAEKLIAKGLAKYAEPLQKRVAVEKGRKS